MSGVWRWRRSNSVGGDEEHVCVGASTALALTEPLTDSESDLRPELATDSLQERMVCAEDGVQVSTFQRRVIIFFLSLCVLFHLVRFV